MLPSVTPSQLNPGATNTPVPYSGHGYHPNFSLKVRPVVFSVDGEKFYADAARLGKLSDPLRDLLFHSAELGTENEGSDENPIVVEGCTKSAFAHFMSWFDHISWDELEIDPLHGNLDVLHMCSLWSITQGVDYAVRELEKCNIHAALRLHIARKYNIDAWFPTAIRELLRMPFEKLTYDHSELIGFPTYIALSQAKEAISHARQQVSTSLPFPKSMDGAPYCGTPSTCKEVWFTVWIREIGRLVHNPNRYIPLSEVAASLRSFVFLGMHAECRDYIIDQIEDQCPGFRRENAIIDNTINDIRRL